MTGEQRLERASFRRMPPCALASMRLQTGKSTLAAARLLTVLFISVVTPGPDSILTPRQPRHYLQDTNTEIGIWAGSLSFQVAVAVSRAAMAGGDCVRRSWAMVPGRRPPTSYANAVFILRRALGRE